MIFCLLFEVSRNPQGELLRTQKIISGETLQIGRGAACKIHLSDHRVDLHHATLTQSPDGKLHITGEAPIKINGARTQNCPLPPGSQVTIGPYLLTVDSASSGPYISLILDETEAIEATPLPEQTEAEGPVQRAPVSLKELGISKRKLGFWLAACILFLFLLLPLLTNISPEVDKWQSSLPVTLTESWSPGPLSKGHSVFGVQCSSCHLSPFVAVSDAVCTECHKKVGKHLADNDMHARLFKEVRCTGCHVDHQGTDGLRLRHDSSRCVSCHGDLKSRKADTTLANVHDFSTDHPPFRITAQNNQGVRFDLPATQPPQINLPGNSGLKYSHRVHLDKNGISSPKGDIVMTCQNCHQPDESGIHFAPISMEKNCQQSGCHGLVFTEPAEGAVPHGSEREVMERLRAYFVKWLADTPENLAQCGINKKTENPLKQTLACASNLAEKNAAASLFRPDVECGECHEIVTSDNADVPWKIAQVRINSNWHANSIFPHGKHDASTCAACHDKMNSNKSADITMPTIEKCRECHVGERPARGKASNSCDSCHRFHGGGDAVKP